MKREGWSKAGGKEALGSHVRVAAVVMMLITVQVSILTEILYNHAIGDWRKAMYVLSWYNFL